MDASGARLTVKELRRCLGEAQREAFQDELGDAVDAALEAWDMAPIHELLDRYTAVVGAPPETPGAAAS